MKRRLDQSEDLKSQLGPSQKIAFAKIIAGDSVFVTGSAGTGKSFLIKCLVQQWEKNGTFYSLTATTGIAAINIGGRTVHSFMWMTIDDDDNDAEKFLSNLMKKPGLYNYYEKQMRQLQCLVIDEVSMLNPTFLSKINDILKIVRSNLLPFGGIQIVLVGDFFQLPPVKSPKFLFELPIFKLAAPNRIILKEVFRQSDPKFIELLGRMRTGDLTEDDKFILQGRVGADVTKFGIVPTQLWSTNKDVDRINDDYLSQNKNEPEKYLRHIGIRSDASTETQASHKEKFARDLNSSFPETVILKGPEDAEQLTGAQVMLSFNLDQERGLVNGSRGIIVEFKCPTLQQSGQLSTSFDICDQRSVLYPKNIKLPLVRFILNGEPTLVLIPYICIKRKLNDGKKTIVFAWSMPLKLAWASTVHKSQGQSLECVKISLDRSIFENGQAYVAVSRARSLEGLTLTQFEPSVITSNELVKKYYAD
jgi:ATP-dependent DNA helicase PIF1